MCIYTPHLDRSRCFAEVSSGRVRARPLFIPFPRAILGRLQALCAAIRCVLVALWVCLFARPEAAVVDIVTPPLAVFAAFGVPTLFYCHFPDKLLARTLVRESGAVRALYRRVIDGAEEVCLRTAGAVAVNSRYTAAAFRAAFVRARTPAVVHPCVDAPSSTEGAAQRADSPPTLLSLNRFERKKNIALAIDALALLRGARAREARLVVAGGWDARVAENVEHFDELRAHAAAAGVAARVDFRRNVSHAEREALVRDADAVLYTPAGEHFGIVPLEAMAAGTPVVAVDDAGPRESVVDGGTGFLCEGKPAAFAEAVERLVEDEGLKERMGEAGRERVRTCFSRGAMADKFEALLLRVVR